MKKRKLWIILFLAVNSALFRANSQAVQKNNDGSYTFDLKPEDGSKEKKKKDNREFVSPDYDPNQHNAVAEEGTKLDREETNPNLNKESLFKGMFGAGVNISQIDGDAEAGYKKVGLNVSAGTLVRVHRLLSVSIELMYSQMGAKPHYSTLSDGSPNHYNVSADYIQIPLSLNIHDKKFVMFGAGLSFGALMRYKETGPSGAPAPDSTYSNYHTPSKFDLSFQCSVQFLIKRIIGIGARFQYSLISLRPADGFTFNPMTGNAHGQYNNMFTFRITYILDPKSLKNQKKKR
ncbi:MAG TPA: porin family protein [Chitinophagales bacterium]